MAKKPKGFGAFDKLARKLVKVPPHELPPERQSPDRCVICGGLLDEGEIELVLKAHRDCQSKKK